LNQEKIPHTLAIVPARGGSKGLPRKNVRLLGDIPLIAHTIRAALKSRVERMIVSTDDDEIAQVAREWGAEVPFTRPPEYSSDTASSLSVLLHALNFMEREEGYRVETVVFLQPTSPFRNHRHLDEALETFASSKKNSLISVTDVQEFHPYFMFTMPYETTLEPLHQLDPRPLRRQDLPSVYRITGATYISRRSYYDRVTEQSAIFDWDSLAAYVMDAPSSVDINDYLDFQRAELLLKQNSGEDA